MNNQYNIKDVKKAIEYMEVKLGAVSLQIEQDDKGRLNFNAWDISKNHVLITVYKNNDENTTKMPEITRTERLP
jgi:hypothetical protein